MVYWLADAFPAGARLATATYSRYGNFANYSTVCFSCQGSSTEKYGDPEGIFSTIPPSLPP